MYKLLYLIVLLAFVVVSTSFSFVAAQTDTSSPSESQLRELYKQRNDALQELVRIEKSKFDQGFGSLSALNSAEKTLLQAKLESVRTSQERIDILKSLLQLAKWREGMTTKDVESANEDPQKLIEAKVDRLNAQIALERELQK